MENQMNATQERIPSADEVRSTISMVWRIASGQICRGREVDGTYETTPRLVGRLLRVGIHDGITQEGEAYQKVEADLLTSNGPVSVGVSTDSKTSSITFAGALAQVKPGALICVEAASAKKPNRFGRHSTYANLSLVNPETLTKSPIKVARDESVSMDDRLETLLDEIREHPAFAPRPQRVDDRENAERDAFDRECKARNWPDSFGAPVEHLALANASLGTKHGSLDELTGDEWVRHLAGLKANVKPDAVPRLLKAAVEAHRKAGSDDYDPFA